MIDGDRNSFDLVFGAYDYPVTFNAVQENVIVVVGYEGSGLRAWRVFYEGRVNFFKYPCAHI